MHLIRWNKTRRFGLELEFVGSSSRRESLRRIIERFPNQRAIVSGYQHNHNNTEWFCKVDSSCGLEVSTPVLSGPNDLKLVCEVTKAIQDAGFNYSDACGQHIHIDVSDFSQDQINILCAYWIKAEQVIMNSHPAHRRHNTYCVLSNNTRNNFRPNADYSLNEIFDTIRNYRGALNLGHIARGKIEFRFGDMTYDLETIKNRVRFLIWFVDLVKVLPAPPNLNWYSPKRLMMMLGLWVDNKYEVQKTFSPAIQSMRVWILKRLKENMPTQYYERDRQMVEEMLTQVGDVAQNENGQPADDFQG